LALQAGRVESRGCSAQLENNVAISAAAKPIGILLPVIAAVAAMASFQIGAAVAKILFPAIGPEGAATLRLVLGALLLLAIARPWRNWPRPAPLLPLLGLGLAMAGTILMFYLAIERLPIGIAIALQFLGPLAVAIAGSRRATDLLWAALAAAGVWLLVGPTFGGAPLDLIGIFWALGAATGWGSYILLGRAASSTFGPSTAALALSLAALMILPAGIWEAGASLLAPTLIPLALLMAVFSSAIPFTLEFYALPRMPARTFAVLMSLEPAFGVLSGLFILGETLAWRQVVGVAMVIIAAAGASWSSTGAKSLDTHANG
jgi:inner membrane transporter RhtA